MFWHKCVCANSERTSHTLTHERWTWPSKEQPRGDSAENRQERHIGLWFKEPASGGRAAGGLLSPSRRPAQAALVSQDRLDSTLAWILSSFPSAVEFASGCVKVTFSEVFHLFFLFKHS